MNGVIAMTYTFIDVDFLELVILFTVGFRIV